MWKPYTQTMDAPQAVIECARQILGLRAEDYLDVPDTFLAELPDMLNSEKYDTQFVIEVKPSASYGTALCFLCGTMIGLDNYPGDYSGRGISTGLGRLENIKCHQLKPGHIEQRKLQGANQEQATQSSVSRVLPPIATPSTSGQSNWGSSDASKSSILNERKRKISGPLGFGDYRDAETSLSSSPVTSSSLHNLQGDADKRRKLSLPERTGKSADQSIVLDISSDEDVKPDVKQVTRKPFTAASNAWRSKNDVIVIDSDEEDVKPKTTTSSQSPFYSFEPIATHIHAPNPSGESDSKKASFFRSSSPYSKDVKPSFGSSTRAARQARPVKSRASTSGASSRDIKPSRAALEQRLASSRAVPSPISMDTKPVAANLTRINTKPASAVASQSASEISDPLLTSAEVRRYEREIEELTEDNATLKDIGLDYAHDAEYQRQEARISELKQKLDTNAQRVARQAAEGMQLDRQPAHAESSTAASQKALPTVKRELGAMGLLPYAKAQDGGGVSGPSSSKPVNMRAVARKEAAAARLARYMQELEENRTKVAALLEADKKRELENALATGIKHEDFVNWPENRVDAPRVLGRLSWPPSTSNVPSQNGFLSPSILSGGFDPYGSVGTLAGPSFRAHLPPDEDGTFDKNLGEFFGGKDEEEGVDFESEKAIESSLKKLGLPDLNTKIPGTEIQLYPHQVLGVAWMVKQEKKKKFRGGLLCDEMGLGKTVQMISTIILNRSSEKKNKTTLIIAPVALLEQWKEEIEAKSKNSLEVLIVHGAKKTPPHSELRQYDVVLTSLGTIASKWIPDDDTAKTAAKNADKKRGVFWTQDTEDRWWDGRDQDHPMFTFTWYRVVIDEAQYIRNRATKASRAVTALDATYRWALTGTPISNNLSDVYSLIRFCRIRPFNDWDEFRTRIAMYEKTRPNMAAKRVQAILKDICMRRTKTSQLGGKQLIRLPTKHFEVVTLRLKNEEREIYGFVQQRSQATLNRYIKEGTVMKNYASVLAMMLRLRQCCGHFALATENTLDSALEDPQTQEKSKIAKLNNAILLTDKETVARIKKQRLDAAVEKITAEKMGDTDGEMDECPICMEPLGSENTMVTKCGHMFCSACIDEHITNAAVIEDAGLGQNYAPQERPCPTCRSPVSHATIFDIAPFEPSPEELAAATGTKAEPIPGNEAKDIAAFVKNTLAEATAAAASISNLEEVKSAIDIKGKGKAKAEDDDDDDETYVDPADAYDSDEEPIKRYTRKEKGKGKALPEAKQLSKLVLSAKLKRMAEDIKAAPAEDKFILISQWTTMLDLVSIYLDEQNIRHLRFQGDMSRTERDQSVKKLNTSPKYRCMLMSLKAGGVGLNLTGANRCIILDLAWNTATENQAMDRIHRLGQNKEVYVTKYVIEDSIEDRMMQLQAHKQGLADGALGEGKGEKMKRMTIQMIKQLFGLAAMA